MVHNPITTGKIANIWNSSRKIYLNRCIMVPMVAVTLAQSLKVDSLHSVWIMSSLLTNLVLAITIINYAYSQCTQSVDGICYINASLSSDIIECETTKCIISCSLNMSCALKQIICPNQAEFCIINCISVTLHIPYPESYTNPKLSTFLLSGRSVSWNRNNSKYIPIH